MKTLFLLALAVASSAVAAHAAERPNVLFLIADDLTKALACYGHPTVQTPNVDRLAAHAVRNAQMAEGNSPANP